MYEIIKSVIQSGRYVLADMLTKIDTLWVQSGLTDDERARADRSCPGGSRRIAIG